MERITLAGKRTQRTAGRAENWVEAWSISSGIDDEIAAELAGADGDALQAAADALKAKFRGVIVLGGVAGGAVSLVAAVGKEHSAKVSAGKIIQTIAPLVGGKGGGKPDNARGGGKDASKLADALNAARDFIANV